MGGLAELPATGRGEKGTGGDFRGEGILLLPVTDRSGSAPRCKHAEVPFAADLRNLPDEEKCTFSYF